MAQLTVKKIIENHEKALAFGGAAGILCCGSLHHLVEKVNRERRISRRAALVFHNITTTHPFIDGNKRTAFITGLMILNEAGYQLKMTPKEKTAFMLEIAQYRLTVADVETRIKSKIEEI